LGPFLMLGVVMVALIEEHAYVSAPLMASLLAAGLIACLQRPSTLTTALSWEPVVYVGKISYGLFLFHAPIFYLGERFKPATPFHLYAGGLIVLTFMVAALSYEFVEKPVLRFRDRREAKPLISVEAIRFEAKAKSA
jgi:peptidoglycan/LPS O-acetylase OafA/YrhL